MRITRLVLSLALTGLLFLSSAALLLAAPFVNLVFEGEDVKLPGKVFRIIKRVEDPSGKVSGNQVLSVPKVPQGQKPEREDVTYTVNIPSDGRYYLWMRTLWEHGCGNSFYVKVQGYDAAEWTIGNDATYGVMHWVALTDGGKNSSQPQPLLLKKGTVKITLGVREGGTMLDQVLLTTDAKKKPAGVYRPTKDVLVKEK